MRNTDPVPVVKEPVEVPPPISKLEFAEIVTGPVNVILPVEPALIRTDEAALATEPILTVAVPVV